MNFDFYIFGVPHGFDIFKGDTGYFQSLFYDGSKENAKLTIHRMSNGQVSYSYLCYNLMAKGNREGSFLGMSIFFTNHYCTDPAKLYRLFETVYKDVILKRKVLLEEITGDPTVQAIFLVNTFNEEANEINSIENVIRKNIDTAFANDFRPISELPLVPQKNINLIAKINNNKGNYEFLKVFREYLWVSISPDYKSYEEDTLSRDAIIGLNNTIGEIQNIYNSSSINVFKGINVSEDIETALKQTQSGKDIIKPYLRTQPELLKQDKKLNEFQNMFQTLLNQLNLKNTGGESIPDYLQEEQTKLQGIDSAKPKPSQEFLDELDKILIETNKNIDGLKAGNNTQENIKKIEKGIKDGKEKIKNWKQEQEKLSNDRHIRLYLQNQSQLWERDQKFDSIQKELNKLKPKNDWIPKIKNKNLIYWIAGIAALVILAALLWKFRPSSKSEYPDTPEYLKLINAGDSLKGVTPFVLDNIDKAIAKYDSAGKLTVENNQAASKIVEVKKAAVDTLKARADTLFNAGGIGNIPKIEGYKAALTQLTMISDKNYGTVDDYKSIVKSYKQQTIDYYTEKIDEKDKVSEKQKYIDYVLELDPNNANALEKKQAAETLKKPAIKPAGPKVPIEATPAKPKISDKVVIGAWNTDQTVDDFLSNIETQLKKKLSEEDFNKNKNYLQMIINNNVSCPVSPAQQTRAKKLMDIPRKF